MNKKIILKIVVSWAAIFLAVFFLLELFFFQYFTKIFPLAAYEKAGLGSALLAQYTKKGVYPKDYIAIFGDSYAYGQGDWSIEGMYKIEPDYHAGHILYKTIKKDVVTFGFPASDSLRANLILPDVLKRFSERVRFKKIGKPSFILIYFYEGNDINDNVEVAEKIFFPKIKNKSEMFDENLFQKNLLPDYLSNNLEEKTIDNIRVKDKLLFLSLFTGLASDFSVLSWKDNFHRIWKPAKIGKETQVRVSGKIEFIPNKVQSPALSLSERQIDLGVYIFKQSLIAVKKIYPDSKIGVVYIPSVVTPYNVVSDFINDYYYDPIAQTRKKPSADIKIRSDQICAAIQSVSVDLGIGFVDSRASLRSEAQHEYLHGPNDWNHFNRKGYEVLAKELAKLFNQLEAGQPASKCLWE